MRSWITKALSRRGVISGGIVAAGGAALAALKSERGANAQGAHTSHEPRAASGAHLHGHGNIRRMSYSDLGPIPFLLSRNPERCE